MRKSQLLKRLEVNADDIEKEFVKLENESDFSEIRGQRPMDVGSYIPTSELMRSLNGDNFIEDFLLPKYVVLIFKDPHLRTSSKLELIEDAFEKSKISANSERLEFIKEGTLALLKEYKHSFYDAYITDPSQINIDNIDQEYQQIKGLLINLFDAVQARGSKEIERPAFNCLDEPETEVDQHSKNLSTLDRIVISYLLKKEDVFNPEKVFNNKISGPQSLTMALFGLAISSRKKIDSVYKTLDSIDYYKEKTARELVKKDLKDLKAIKVSLGNAKQLFKLLNLEPESLTSLDLRIKAYDESINLYLR